MSFCPLPERRDSNGEHIEPVEEVLTESPGADLFIQVPVAGRDDPDINLDGVAGSPDARIHRPG